MTADSPPALAILGARVNALRVQRVLSKVQLAKLLGLSTAHVTDFLNGKGSVALERLDDLALGPVLASWRQSSWLTSGLVLLAIPMPLLSLAAPIVGSDVAGSVYAVGGLLAFLAFANRPIITPPLKILRRERAFSGIVRHGRAE